MSPPISVIDLPYFQDSHVYFNALKQLKGCSWLDSGVESSQFDILSAEPIAHFSNVNAEFLQNQLERLRLNHEPSSFGDLPFTGGLIGYTCYEHQHPEFGLHPHQSGRNSNFWYLYDWALIQDHKLKKCSAIFLASCSNEAQSKTLSLLNNAHKLPRASSEAFSTSSFISDMSRSYYSEAFKKIKDYILAGDVYQVNFSQRFKAKFEGEIPAAYMHLRTKLSGSYSAYFDTGHERILSFSPEQFIQIKGAKAQTKPIKGTIKRGNNESEDAKLARILQESEKNRAENLMIVDLLRNDFSKNCNPHSIKVPKLFELESYANVHHLVSTVTGRLKRGTHGLNFFNDCFPGGSITGAPKKRAMEIIAELETHEREIYCGSIAYLSTNGNLDSSITIRTLLERNGNIYCWGGGGIVADSNEEEEYRESIQKVEVLMNALSNKQ